LTKQAATHSSCSPGDWFVWSSFVLPPPAIVSNGRGGGVEKSQLICQEIIYLWNLTSGSTIWKRGGGGGEKLNYIKQIIHGQIGRGENEATHSDC